MAACTRAPSGSNSPAMTISALFPTLVWQAELADAALLARLAHAARALAAQDRAGLAWSRAHAYRGYTSYASLNDLPRRDPDFADLARWLVAQAARFAAAAHLDLGGKKPRLDSLWVNILKPGGGHSGHIHPHSSLSGTLYLEVPPGAGAIRFEDPRLGLMMHAPQRTADAPEEQRNFVAVAPRAGLLLLWESWLRHEVLPNGAKAERISVSFNFS